MQRLRLMDKRRSRPEPPLTHLPPFEGSGEVGGQGLPRLSTRQERDRLAGLEVGYQKTRRVKVFKIVEASFPFPPVKIAPVPNAGLDKRAARRRHAERMSPFPGDDLHPSILLGDRELPVRDPNGPGMVIPIGGEQGYSQRDRTR